MPIIGGSIAAGGSIGASIIGGNAAQDAAAKGVAAQQAALGQAQANAAQAVAQLTAIGIPSIQAEQIVLQSPQLVGLLQNQQLGPSAMQNVQGSQAAQSAQMSALQALRQQSAQGLTPQDLNSYRQLQNNLNSNLQAQNATIQQQAQQQNQWGGGQQLASMLANQQSQYGNANNNANNIAAQSVANRNAAIMNLGNLGGQIQGQQFGEQAQIANAKDAINQFNLNNSRSTQAANLSAQQQVANAAAATNNAQQQYNSGLVQQNYQNQMGKAQAIGNALSGASQTDLLGGSQALTAAQNQANGLTSMYGGIGQGISAIGQGVSANSTANSAANNSNNSSLQSYIAGLQANNNGQTTIAPTNYTTTNDDGTMS